MKRHIKSILAFLLAVLMVVSLSACISVSDTNDIKDVTGDDTDDIKDITPGGSESGNAGEEPDDAVSDPTDSTENEDEEEKEDEQDNEVPVAEETTISEKICFEYDGLVVTAKNIVESSYLGTGIKLHVENNSDKDYTVGVEEVIVNNCMTASYFSCDVAAGKKANDTLYLSSSDLEAAGISNIGQVEIYFYVYDSSSYERLYETDCITITTSLYDKMDTSVDDAGYTLYDEDGIKIKGKYVDESTFWGASILLYIENTSDQNITVSCTDMSINGYMVSGYLYATVYQGKYAISDITVYESDLEENDITTVDEVELKFHIYNPDNYFTIVETDAISFSTK